MKMPPLNASLLLATSALTLVLAAPALAQSAGQTPAPATTAPQGQAAVQKPAQSAGTQTPAQTTPAQGSAEEPIETVTITGAKSLTKIDRDVYDPKTDPDTPVSAAADALNKAPGVNVDPEGNVTLRGNSSVQVYIDGKPSPMTQGDFRALTLQSMPADDIDTIEVINNPGAEFGAEGGAGIININLKKGRNIRPQLGIRANAGSFGRYSVAAQGGYGKKLGTGTILYRGQAAVNHMVNESSSDSDSQNLRNGSTTERSGDGRNTNDNYRLNGGIEYSPNDNDTLSAQLTFTKGESNRNSQNRTVIRNGSAVVTDDYNSRVDDNTDTNQTNLQLGFNHKGDTDGETFKANIQMSRGDTDKVTLTDYSNVDASKDYRQDFLESAEQKTVSINADYSHGLWGGSFGTGFDINTNESTSDASQYKTMLTTGVREIDPRRTNSVVRNQDQYEAYVTYQRPIGEKWTVRGGLRVEETKVSLNRKIFYNPNPDPNAVVDPVTATSYVNYHPSFTGQYLLSEKSKFRYSYSHRVSRPRIDDMNPSIIYSSERNARQGNPNLKPAETHGNNLRYDYFDRASNTSLGLSYYYNKTENIVVDRSVYIDPNNTPNDPSDDVLLTRRENGAEGLEQGVEVLYRGRITQQLTYDLQANFKREEQPPRSGTATTTSITQADSVSGRMVTRYTFKNQDQIQLTLNQQGKALSGQGYRDPVLDWNASYGHRINSKLRLTLSANGRGKTRNVIDSDTIKQVSMNENGGTVFMVAITFNPFGFGGGGREGGGMRQGGERMGGPGGGGGNWGGGGGGNNNPGGGF